MSYFSDTFEQTKMNVYNVANDQDLVGGVNKGEPTAVASNVDCQVAALSADQRMLNLARGIDITHEIVTEQAGITNGQVVKILDAAGSPGTTLAVIQIKKRYAWGLFNSDWYVLGCREIMTGA